MSEASPAADTLEVRSYRTVFDLERRVYRIDRLRLNPSGVPVRGLLYFVALLGTVAVAGRLPVVGAVLHLAPWYLRDVALPGAAAAVLTLIRVDGRPFHLVVGALARHRLRPHRVCRLGCGPIPPSRWRPPDVLVLPDGSDHRVRRLRYRGPGMVLVAVAHERIEWPAGFTARLLRRPDLTVRQLGSARALQCAQLVELGPGCRLALDPPRLARAEIRRRRTGRPGVGAPEEHGERC